MTNRHSNEEPNLAGAKLGVPNCQTTPPQSGESSLAGSPIPIGLPNCQARLQGPPSSVPSSDDAITALCDLKTRINAGIAYLQKHSNDPARFAKGRSRLVHLCVEEYRPALTDLAAFTPRRDLHHRRMQLKRRLHVGMTRDSEKAADRFIELLTQYEVLTDALRDDAVATTMRRIVQMEGAAA